MPNLRPPITTTTAAVAYRERILKSLPTDIDFNPLMTLYLTDNMKSEEIKLASKFFFCFFVEVKFSLIFPIPSCF